MWDRGAHRAYGGFTLIELSIVLVIIGLIVGGVLVGQSLINAAGVRAQVTQIEKYNTAANTLREKYGYLPGDITATAAKQFGLASRLGVPGSGDGNGVIEGYSYGSSTVYDWNMANGETALFWVDLSSVRLIDGSFSTASGSADTPNLTLTSTPSVSAFLPQAKLGSGNFIYVYSNGVPQNGSINYFGLSAVNQISATGVESVPGLMVSQAYAIDGKVDDGYPQTGRVTSTYLSNAGPALWAGTLVVAGAVLETPLAGSSTTCFDNGNTNGVARQYSVEIGNGANVNCALTFRMQAGD